MLRGKEMKQVTVLIGLVATLIFFSAAVSATDGVTARDRQIQEQINYYLWEAARQGNNQQIGVIIAGKYDLNVADKRGFTAIILAAYHGHDETVKMLIEAGADPCQRDKRGNSALMGAIFKGEIKVARRLINAKCLPDMRNNAGQTAAMYASLFQRQELLQALREKGADMQATDVNGNSVATLAEGKINGIQ